MRSLTIEFYEKESGRFLAEPLLLEKIESYETLYLLKFSPEQFAEICRIKLKDPYCNIESLFSDNQFNVQLLECEKEGTCIYFIKGKPPLAWSVGRDNETTGVFFCGREIKDGKITVRFLVYEKQVETLLGKIEKIGVRFKIVSLIDAKFSYRSPISCLTEKQKKAAILAYKSGYYDTPRKTSTRQLAKKLGLVSSTLTVHLRKAERRLLANMLKES